MKKWLIVRKEDMKVLHDYESEEKKDSSAHWNYTWAEPHAMHVECPENLDVRWAKVEEQEIDEVMQFVAVEDSDKRDEIESQELEAAWAKLRADRDKLLAECDHVMLADYPITQQKKDEYEAYRQALRDFPSSVTDPRDEYTFPAKPE